MTAIHIPLQPTWNCCGCGERWPCESARRRLLAAYADAPVSLRVVMGLRLVDAAENLHDVSGEALYERFVGWARLN